MGESDQPKSIIEAKNALEALVLVGEQTAMTPKRDWMISSEVDQKIKHGLEVLNQRGYIQFQEGDKYGLMIYGALTPDGKRMYQHILKYFIAHQIDTSKNLK